MAVQLFWYQLHKNQISPQRMEVFTLYIYTKETNAQLLIYAKIYIVYLYLLWEKYFSKLWKLLTYVNEIAEKGWLHESSDHFV